MSKPLHWLARLKGEWLLWIFTALTLLMAWLDPQPWSQYRQWLNLPTLAGLLGLLLAIQGIRDSGLVQRAAITLAARTHGMRTLGLLLVAATALLSMVLTNDVSLFLIVPLTVAIGAISNLPVLRMVVLEALAVNAGSSLSPIGNPQNLLLWQHGGQSFFAFVGQMLAPSALMLGLVALLTVLWLPRQRVSLRRDAIEPQPLAVRLGVGSTLALLGMVLAMEYQLAPWAAIALLLVYLGLARRCVRELDWALLATFVAIFLGLGHLAAYAPVQHALAQLDLSRPWALYLAGIVASQLISNVPATVLLLGHDQQTMLLAVAVNVGGFGVVIGSLANLIALRLARQPGGMKLFHLVSLPFLLVSAPLVYLLWVAMH